MSTWCFFNAWGWGGRVSRQVQRGVGCVLSKIHSAGLAVLIEYGLLKYDVLQFGR